MRNRSLLAIWLVVAGAGPLAAQETPVGRVLDRTTHTRWVVGAQKDSATAWTDGRVSMRIDSVSRTAEGLSYRLTSGITTAVMALANDGAVRNLAVSVRAPATLGATPGASAGSARRFNFELTSQDYIVSMPLFRFADLGGTFRATAPARGVAWTDTINVADSRDDMQQRVTGVRRRTVLGDTTIDGRHVWLVRDSARVAYSESFPTDEIVNGRAVRRTREGAGTWTAVSAFDPAWLIFTQRADTIRVLGVATERYPDGRSIVVPARMERFSTTMLKDSAALRAERAVAADRAAASRARTMEDLQASSALRRRPAAFFLATHDTAGALNAIAHGVWDRIDTTDARLVIAVMRDPAVALRNGVRMDFIVGNTYAVLTRRIPALTPDTAKWSCVPRACAILAEQYENARDPALRELGLAAHVLTDPARWGRIALGYNPPAGSDFERIAELTRGIGATWPAASHEPVPLPSSPWPAWEQWMNGVLTTYQQRPIGNRDTINRVHPPARFGPTHKVALEFQQRMTGRDFAAEFKSALAAAQNDTARLVYRTMLIGIGAYEGQSGEVVNRLLNGSPVEQQSAAREAIAIVDRARPAPAAVADSLRDQLLRLLFNGDSVWLTMNGQRSFLGKISVPAGDSVFIRMVGAGQPLREKWAPKGVIVTDSSWTPPFDRIPAAVVAINRILMDGPLVSITYDYSYRTPTSRIAPARGAYSTGGTIYLVRVDGGWKIVSANVFVT